MITIESQKTTLYYREGSSDKIYQCAIEPAGTRFVVNFAYGRRGSTLNTGTKTNVPVDYDSAARIYDKLVKEKTAKGYTPGPSGVPYHNSPKSKSTGILPQLLNPIAEDEVNRFIADKDYWMQEKFDGRRLLIQKQGIQITGINKKGLVVGLPEIVIESAKSLLGDFILYGESIGDEFFVFDLLSLNTMDLRPQGYRERLVHLYNIIASAQQRSITLVSTAFNTIDKVRMLNDLKAAKKEGVVFKLLSAPYSPGRPNTGGPQVKHKFYATLSAVVSKQNTQRSVEIQLWGEDGWQAAGNVTIPANHSIPPVGAVIECRYLYALKQSGVLYQPVFLGVRSDVEPGECLASQLKFKPEEE